MSYGVFRTPPHLRRATPRQAAALGTLTVAPIYTQTTFRGRNDDGTETTATWKAAAGADWTQNVDENFRARFNIASSVAPPIQSTFFRCFYSRNGGSYIIISNSSSVVRCALSPHIDDSTAAAETTEQLAGAGSFNPGHFADTFANGPGFIQAPALNQDTEMEYSLTIRSADVNNGDTIGLRVYNNDSTPLNGGYTDTPVITVSEIAPTQPINLVGMIGIRGEA